MKLIRVCYEDYSGKEKVCIDTLELHPAQIERFRVLGMIAPEGDQVSLEELRRLRKALRYIDPWG